MLHWSGTAALPALLTWSLEVLQLKGKKYESSMWCLHEKETATNESVHFSVTHQQTTISAETRKLQLMNQIEIVYRGKKSKNSHQPQPGFFCIRMFFVAILSSKRGRGLNNQLHFSSYKWQSKKVLAILWISISIFGLENH